MKNRKSWQMFAGSCMTTLAGGCIWRHAPEGQHLLAALLVLIVGVGGVLYGDAK